jgi:hypothetical protein
VADPARWTNGEPENMAASATDALLWLDVLVAAAAMVRMSDEDCRRLKACRAALARHVGWTGAPSEFAVNVAKPAQPLTNDEIDLIASGMRNAAGGIYATSVYEFARAIEARVRGEGGVNG